MPDGYDVAWMSGHRGADGTTQVFRRVSVGYDTAADPGCQQPPSDVPTCISGVEVVRPR